MKDIKSEDISRLSRIFNNTTATYKFFWFLALLKFISEGRGCHPISFAEMVALILAKSWRPLAEKEVSFGKCDALCLRLSELAMCSPLSLQSPEDRVRWYITSNADSPTVKTVVDKLTTYVPYRFLYPWIGSCSNAVAKTRSQDEAYRCPYRIEGKTISVNPLWHNYLLNHCEILWDFTLCNLYKFFEKKTPDFILPMSEIVVTADGLGYRLPNISVMFGNKLAEDKPRIINKYTNNFYEGSQNVNTINKQINKHHHGRRKEL